MLQENELENVKKLLKAKYHKEWREKNKEKMKKSRENWWNKKALEYIKKKEEKQNV